ncbi:MAG: hypothetical protein V7K57_25690 [Nostoc sp.]|uniref:hypothetical protein n=1 Tax=Nostoc sp. TaxID=1180 RepID=UPI002FF60FE1
MRPWVCSAGARPHAHNRHNVSTDAPRIGNRLAFMLTSWLVVEDAHASAIASGSKRPIISAR